jgi:hypothetical protein
MPHPYFLGVESNNSPLRSTKKSRVSQSTHSVRTCNLLFPLCLHLQFLKGVSGNLAPIDAVQRANIFKHD